MLVLYFFYIKKSCNPLAMSILPICLLPCISGCCSHSRESWSVERRLGLSNLNHMAKLKPLDWDGHTCSFLRANCRAEQKKGDLAVKPGKGKVSASDTLLSISDGMLSGLLSPSPSLVIRSKPSGACSSTGEEASWTDAVGLFEYWDLSETGSPAPAVR